MAQKYPSTVSLYIVPTNISYPTGGNWTVGVYGAAVDQATQQQMMISTIALRSDSIMGTAVHIAGNLENNGTGIMQYSKFTSALQSGTVILRFPRVFPDTGQLVYDVFPDYPFSLNCRFMFETALKNMDQEQTTVGMWTVSGSFNYTFTTHVTIFSTTTPPGPGPTPPPGPGPTPPPGPGPGPTDNTQNDVEQILEAQIADNIVDLVLEHDRTNSRMIYDPSFMSRSPQEMAKEYLMNQGKQFFEESIQSGKADLSKLADIAKEQVRNYTTEKISSGVKSIMDTANKHLPSMAKISDQQMQETVQDWTPSQANIEEFMNDPSQFVSSKVKKSKAHYFKDKKADLQAFATDQLNEQVLAKIQKAAGYDERTFTPAQMKEASNLFIEQLKGTKVFRTAFEKAEYLNSTGSNQTSTIDNSVSDFVVGNDAQLQILGEIFDHMLSDPAQMGHVTEIYDKYYGKFDPFQGQATKLGDYYTENAPDWLQQIVNVHRQSGGEGLVNSAAVVAIMAELGNPFALTLPAVAKGASLKVVSSSVGATIGAAALPTLLGTWLAYQGYKWMQSTGTTQEQLEQMKTTAMETYTIVDRQKDLVRDFIKATIHPETEYDFRLKQMTEDYIETRQIHDMRQLLQTPYQKELQRQRQVEDNMAKIQHLAHEVAHRQDEQEHLRQPELGFYSNTYEQGASLETLFNRDALLPEARLQQQERLQSRIDVLESDFLSSRTELNNQYASFMRGQNNQQQIDSYMEEVGVRQYVQRTTYERQRRALQVELNAYGGKLKGSSLPLQVNSLYQPRINTVTQTEVPSTFQYEETKGDMLSNFDYVVDNFASESNRNLYRAGKGTKRFLKQAAYDVSQLTQLGARALYNNIPVSEALEAARSIHRNILTPVAQVSVIPGLKLLNPIDAVYRAKSLLYDYPYATISKTGQIVNAASNFFYGESQNVNDGFSFARDAVPQDEFQYDRLALPEMITPQMQELPKPTRQFDYQTNSKGNYNLAKQAYQLPTYEPEFAETDMRQPTHDEFTYEPRNLDQLMQPDKQLQQFQNIQEQFDAEQWLGLRLENPFENRNVDPLPFEVRDLQKLRVRVPQNKGRMDQHNNNPLQFSPLERKGAQPANRQRSRLSTRSHTQTKTQKPKPKIDTQGMPRKIKTVCGYERKKIRGIFKTVYVCRKVKK